jgi:gluconolactonase
MELREIATGLRFPEGPIALPDGSFLVVEIERRALTRIEADGHKTVVAETGGGPNGAAVGPDGKCRELSRGPGGGRGRGSGISQEVAGEGIRVNAVSPGLTPIDMPAPAALKRGPSIIPMSRVGDAEEIAKAVLWLLSDWASFVAGANIRVAGGRP